MHSATGLISTGRRVLPCGLFLCLAVGPWQCHAQDGLDFHSCTAAIGAGVEKVPGRDGDNTKGVRWNLQAGGGFAANHYLFITANFAFDQMGLTQAAVTNTNSLQSTKYTDGNARYYTTTLDPTLRFPLPRWSRGASVYFLGGFGWLRRSIDFVGAQTEPVVIHPTSPLLGSFEANSGVFDAGAGVNVPIHRGLMAYAEVRVYQGLAINHATILVPFTFGVRW